MDINRLVQLLFPSVALDASSHVTLVWRTTLSLNPLTQHTCYPLLWPVTIGVI